MRGEDHADLLTIWSLLETPPRARGRLCLVVRRKTSDRNTPACAGKTSPPSPAVDSKRKHSRVRGEDIFTMAFFTSFPETPPRARGRHRSDAEGSAEPGNTPACAGKTSPPSPAVDSKRKHSRVRGEDIFTMAFFTSFPETPPRARGRHRSDAEGSAEPGNTPACAGKTVAMRKLKSHLRKHPRVRGEDPSFRPQCK